MGAKSLIKRALNQGATPMQRVVHPQGTPVRPSVAPLPPVRTLPSFSLVRRSLVQGVAGAGSFDRTARDLALSGLDRMSREDEANLRGFLGEVGSRVTSEDVLTLVTYERAQRA